MSKNSWRKFKASLEHKGKVYTIKGQITIKRGKFPGEVEINSINDNLNIMV